MMEEVLSVLLLVVVWEDVVAFPVGVVASAVLVGVVLDVGEE